MVFTIIIREVGVSYWASRVHRYVSCTSKVSTSLPWLPHYNITMWENKSSCCNKRIKIKALAIYIIIYTCIARAYILLLWWHNDVMYMHMHDICMCSIKTLMYVICMHTLLKDITCTHYTTASPFQLHHHIGVCLIKRSRYHVHWHIILNTFSMY